MLHKSFLLLAIAGLFVLAFAGHRPGPGTPAGELDARLRVRDSLLMLHAQRKGAALPAGIDVNRVIERPRSGQKPTPLLDLPNDPFYGHSEYEVAPDAPTGDQYYTSVAFDGTHYLVVWEDERYDTSDIYGALVTTTGAPVDPDEEGFLISDYVDKSWPQWPAVAFDGTNYLVVWTDNNSNDNFDVYGALVSTAGAVLDDPGVFPITQPLTPGNQYQSRVAFDGTNYLVVWSDDRTNDIYGARVSTSGQVVSGDENGIPIGVGSDIQEFPAIAFDGSNYLVVWEDNRNWGSRGWEIYGEKVSPADMVRTALGPLSNSTADEFVPTVAFDGSRYLVAWYDSRNDTDKGYDIYGTFVSTGGTPVGDFPITYADYDQTCPSITFDGTDYLVAWVDHPPSRCDINGCRRDLDGDLVDAFSISTTGPVGGSIAPRAACGGGTVLVTYSGGGNSGRDRALARAGTVVPTGDVGADSIMRPVASFLMPSWKIPPLVRIKNFGPETQGPFDVRFTISPGSYTSTKTVQSLAPGATCAVEFDSLTPDYGAFTARCTTMMDRDLYPGNDARTAYFQGCDDILYSDAMSGDYFAVSPSGTWALGDPTSPWTLPSMDASAWGYQLDGTKDYDGSMVATLTSPQYTALQDHPAIAFQHSFNTEPGVDGGDLSYSTNGSVYDTLIPSAGLGYGGVVTALGDSGWSGTSTAGWNQSVFTLTHVTKDSPFWIRWRFASDGSNNNYHGWLIDEVGFINHDPADGGKPSGHGSVIDTVKVWPNLVHGTAQVNYTLVKDCNVAINLYDASGRLAARVPTSGFKRGKNTARLDANGLARGVYFVKVRGETDTRTTKVVIE